LHNDYLTEFAGFGFLFGVFFKLAAARATIFFAVFCVLFPCFYCFAALGALEGF
jgi:hypothetical protein